MWPLLKTINRRAWDGVEIVGELIGAFFGEEWKWVYAALVVLVLAGIVAMFVVVIRWVFF